ncbi:MAG: hypothetical protein ACTSPD_02495 [Promethearchaeota archaeon]
MSYYIAFDVAHKPRGKIDENYTELRDHLNANNFVCYNFLETPITQESLKSYDILVFACPDFAKVSSQEITEIEHWVEEDGGGLLLLSHAGGDKGRNSNLNDIGLPFGIAFENDQVLDEQQNIGMENMPLISTFIPPHPITNEISEICYRAGCSLSIVGNAFSIASSNETSDPFSCPLIIVSEHGNGRVCAIGSYEMFRDRIGGGFSYSEHSKLAMNIFNWLVTDYRIELRSEGTIATPSSMSRTTSAQYSGVGSEQNTISGDRAIDLELSIRISNKSELMELLKIFSNQINTIKNTIDKLIEKISVSEDEIIQIKREAYDQTAISTQISDIQTTSTTINEEITSTTQKEPVKDIFELTPAPLTALPPKPKTLLSKQESKTMEDDITSFPTPDASIESNLEVKQETLPEPEKKKKPKKEKKEKKIDKEELQAELESLESKLNSVHNLLSFIEKKHTSGKMDEKDYEKQTKKLKNDIDKTSKRIAEIKKLLEQ